MNKPILSICIATYNRADYIGETLESIIPQLTEEVEVVIVDGASTDSTGSVVKRYAEACNQIRYILLPSKGGVDQDYCVAVEHARGEMCWLFPDDDLLKPSAIKTVLDEVQKGYSLIIVNSEVMNGDFSKILAEMHLQIKSNEVFAESELEQLFRRIVPYISFIGCVVINRDLWLKREKERYYGTEFIHVGVIFQAPLPGPTLLIAEPYITIRYGNAQWTSRALEVWMFKWPNLMKSFTCLSERTRMDYHLEKPFQRVRKIVTYRALGAYSRKEYQKWFVYEDSPLWLKMIEFFVAIIPIYFVNLVLLIYLKTKKRKEYLQIYDLENSKYNLIKLLRLTGTKKQKGTPCI